MMPFHIEHETCVSKQIYAARVHEQPRAQKRASRLPIQTDIFN